MVNIPIVDSHALDHIVVKGLKLFDWSASDVNVLELFARTAHLLDRLSPGRACMLDELASK